MLLLPWRHAPPLCSLTLKFICHRMKGAKEKNSVMMVANLLYTAHLGVESVVIATPPPPEEV